MVINLVEPTRQNLDQIAFKIDYAKLMVKADSKVQYFQNLI